MGDGPILTMGAMIRASAARRADKEAILFPDERLTFAELDRRATNWAKALIAQGIGPGDHVGLLLPTCVEFITAFYGITMTGAVAVPVNARYQAGELGYVVANADLVTIITTGEIADGVDFSARLEAALPSLREATDAWQLALPEAPKLRSVICLDEQCASYLGRAADALAKGRQIDDAEVDARIAAVAPQDIAMILYTSGTTANPKGAMISHRAQISNSRNLGRRYACSEIDKVWSPLPIFHIAGILPMTMILDLGGVYMTIPRFDPGIGLRMLGEEGATVAYPSFVTIMQDLISHPSFRETDLSKLRVMNSNFAVQPEWIKLAVAAAMPDTIQVGTYGLTEAAGTVSTSRLTDSYEVRTGRCGVPLDEWDVRIVDPDSGADLAAGQRGEIVLGGPNILQGYYNAPEKTAEAIRDGWFYTGDIGSIDADGNLMFHGRTKDMLKVGGENVAAVEIETILQAHPAVKLAQVVGIPDERYSEVPAAFIELSEGAGATSQELIDHCRGRIASFKLPRHIRFVTEWPMSTSKIQKFRLRETLIADLQTA